MKTVKEIRLDNLNELVRQEGDVIAKVATKSLTNPNYLYQIIHRVHASNDKPRNLGSLVARRIEASYGKPPGWMDHDHIMENLSSEKNVVEMPARQNVTPYESLLIELMGVAKTINDRGLTELIVRANDLALKYPAAKANPVN